MKIIIIAAVASNRVIGRNGRLPWKIPEDLAHFKKSTMGHPLLMGRITYESIGIMLPGRDLLVITSKPKLTSDIGKPKILKTIESGINYALSMNAEKLFICGGEKIYKYAIHIADEMLITQIDDEFEGDTFFPKINNKEWAYSVIDTIGGYNLLRYIRSSRKNLVS